MIRDKVHRIVYESMTCEDKSDGLANIKYIPNIWRVQYARFTKVIYAPMIYTAPCIMFLMHADTLRGQVGGGWALEI